MEIQAQTFKHCNWETVVPLAGTLPYERSNHTCVVHNDKIYIFGGEDQFQNLLNDIVIYTSDFQYCYSLSTNKMLATHNKKLVIEPEFNYNLQQGLVLCSIPPPRSFHTSVVFNNFMVVFGGCSSDTMGEVYFLDLREGLTIWSVFVSKDTPDEVKKPRFQHTANLWGSNMVIFGGISGNMLCQPDLIILDLVKLKWRVIQCEGAVPVYGHTSFVKDDKLYVIGGKTQYDLNMLMIIDLSCGKVELKDNFFSDFSYSPGVLSTASYDPEGDKLIVFGGYRIDKKGTEFGCNNQVYIYDFKSERGCIIYPGNTKNAPSPLCGHSAVYYNGKLLVFGGSDRLPLLNGQWVFCDFSSTLWTFTPPSNEEFNSQFN